MDYLDPKKKRNHKIRLLIGYALFGVVIVIATILMNYLANGYDIDRETGRVIQNGLVYIDTKPSGAEVYLNGEKQRGTTDARLVIPSGTYEIELRKPGYRNWSRSLRLEGGSLRRLTYARLIPETLDTSVATSLRSDPSAVSQSIDKRWLVVSYESEPLNLALVDLDSDVFSTSQLEISEDLVDNPEDGVLEVVEWAADNRYFLASYTVGKKTEYILVDRENPDRAVNVSDALDDSNRLLEITLQDRKNDRFFVYNADQKSLFTASIEDGIDTPSYLSGVHAYKNFGDDWTLYITDSDEKDMVEARFKRGDQDILLKLIQEDDSYLLQLARLGNAPIMGISSPVEDRAIVYNDPQNYLDSNPEASIPVATTALRVTDPLDLIISQDSSVIMAYGPSNFATHEFEADRSYNFSAGVELDEGQELRWLDGQHFLFSADGVQTMMDFDGSNRYELVESLLSIGSFFSDDLQEMYTFKDSFTPKGDTEKTPARMHETLLLTPEDR